MHEASYSSVTSLEHRKRFGQFFTPSNVADLMVSWVLSGRPKSILDPAFGLGIFFDSFMKNKGKVECSYHAYEIDENIINHFQRPQNGSLDLEIADYCEIEPGGFDGIVCNPPYMRFQNFLNRHDVLSLIEKTSGVKLTGYSNSASIFLVKSIEELNEGGRLSYIMPFEFFNTGYGTEVKKKLLQNGLLKKVLFFSNEKDIFPDAVTTVCVLFCCKDGIKNTIKIAKVDSLEKLADFGKSSDYFEYELSHEKLPPHKKWFPIISGLYESVDIPDGMTKIYDYGKFSRGIASGANVFFSLTHRKIQTLGLGKNYKKCITKSSQIRQLVFTETDFDRLVKRGAAVFCLDAENLDKKEVADYIRYGESRNFHTRYLTRNRTPWYKLESRFPAPIMAGVFNRGKLKVIRNFTDAINLTCFHSFYPDMFGKMYINRLFVYLISTIGQKIVMTNKRSYGGGLDKFEPGDLNDCHCPSMTQFNMCSEKDAEEIIRTAVDNEDLAISLADELMEKILDVSTADMSSPLMPDPSICPSA